jgi:hypothetical protein
MGDSTEHEFNIETDAINAQSPHSKELKQTLVGTWPVLDTLSLPTLLRDLEDAERKYSKPTVESVRQATMLVNSLTEFVENKKDLIEQEEIMLDELEQKFWQPEHEMSWRRLLLEQGRAELKRLHKFIRLIGAHLGNDPASTRADIELEDEDAELATIERQSTLCYEKCTQTDTGSSSSSSSSSRRVPLKTAVYGDKDGSTQSARDGIHGSCSSRKRKYDERDTL